MAIAKIQYAVSTLNFSYYNYIFIIKLMYLSKYFKIVNLKSEKITKRIFLAKYWWKFHYNFDYVTNFNLISTVFTDHSPISLH